MKTFISLSALILSLSLTAQTNPATWYLNDESGGIQLATNNASGTYSTAMGRITTASGEFSTAMGYQTEASGNYSTAMGRDTTASGYASTAMGFQTTASDYNSLVLGQWNLLGSTVTNSATNFSLENTAFVIGNGTNSTN